jgi:predicted PurR-regulated permease PerM
MPLRKYKHILTFFLLFQALFLLSVPFFEQKDGSSVNLLTNYRNNQEKKHISAVFFLKNRNGAFQNHKSRFQSLTKEASAILSSGFSYLKSDYRQYNLTVERLTKLMLFPYHSFW